MELERFVAPAIGGRRAGDAHVGRRVVRPQGAEAAADGTVARGELRRRTRDLELHRAAVTGTGDHGDSIAHSRGKTLPPRSRSVGTTRRVRTERPANSPRRLQGHVVVART